MGGINVRYEVAGTQDGTTVLDRETGLPLESELQQDLEGEITMEGEGQEPLSWPISLESTITVETIE
jgi:hypothetical protein